MKMKTFNEFLAFCIEFKDQIQVNNDEFLIDLEEDIQKTWICGWWSINIIPKLQINDENINLF